MAGRRRLTDTEKFERVVAGDRKPATKYEASKAQGAREDRSVAAHHAEPLEAAVAAFKVAYPDAWEALRLCPLQHGLDDMIAKLK